MDFPIRVLFLSAVMDRGGAEVMIMNYYRNIDRTRVQFDFLVPDIRKGLFDDEILSLGGNIYRLCTPHPRHYFKYRLQARRLFREHPEIKILHSNIMGQDLFAFMEAKKAHIPIRITHSHISRSKPFPKLKGMAIKLMRKAAIKYATEKFACGEEAAKWMFGTTENVTLMNNAIEVEKYIYNPDTARAVREEFTLGDRFVIGHVGRFADLKNHPFLIDIFSEVVKRKSDAMLMLVGAIDESNPIYISTKEKVHALGLDDNVIFTGVRSDVNRIMQSFDVFLLPSLREGFPVVMVEAQSSGLKCVISDHVPIESDITGNVEMISLEKDASYWAEHLLAYNNGYERKDTSEAIKKAGFDIKANAKWLENYYIEQLSKISK